MLDARSVRSYGEIAGKEGLTRARVTQIMNLLKLPPEWKAFLARLDDPKEKSSEKTRTKKKQPPRVIAVEIDEHLSLLNLEVLKELIRKAALRKLKELEKEQK